VPGDGSAGAAVPGADGTPGARSPRRAGRNLPAALGVGLLLGGLAIVTLFTVKATFLIYLAVAVGVALWELSRALGTRDIRLPLVRWPLAVSRRPCCPSGGAGGPWWRAWP
jgi:phosphatidate cytidylyltransferase